MKKSADSPPATLRPEVNYWANVPHDVIIDKVQGTLRNVINTFVKDERFWSHLDNCFIREIKFSKV